jgi:REP element-mobilizing transposase RayT
LYGDQRGSVDDDHNVYGTPFLPNNSRRLGALRQRLTHPPLLLNDAARAVVAQTIREHCEQRSRELLAVNVRSNHVHVVVGFAGIAPEKMMGELKAWSSRRLREHGLVVRGRAVWTRHGSTRYLWTRRDIEPATRYVVEGQDG